MSDWLPDRYNSYQEFEDDVRSFSPDKSDEAFRDNLRKSFLMTKGQSERIRAIHKMRQWAVEGVPSGGVPTRSHARAGLIYREFVSLEEKLQRTGRG